MFLLRMQAAVDGHQKSPRRIASRGLYRFFDDAILPVFCPTGQG